MIGENRQLVTDEPVEVQDCRKIADHFRGIHRIYPNSVKQNRRMSSCNRLDLQTPGSQPVRPKNLPDHRCKCSLQYPETRKLGHYTSMVEIEALIRVSFWRALQLLPFNWRVGPNPRRHSKNIKMKYKTHIKLVRELYGTCFQYNAKN